MHEMRVKDRALATRLLALRDESKVNSISARLLRNGTGGP